MPNTNKKLLMGNEAIALALSQQGCKVALAYPGTPSSEILPAFRKWCEYTGASAYVQWAINEKVAFEIAYTASITGLRAMVAMKQVGLNVASDALMSAAYMGVRAGFILISADDPGPHSSQTEQDSRMMAMIAKVPVLDPSSPSVAMELIQTAYAISETYEIPVMLRPTTRVCHGSQDIAIVKSNTSQDLQKAGFQKETTRWASTPVFRLIQHRALNDKITKIGSYQDTEPRLLNRGKMGGSAIVSSGVALAHLIDLIMEENAYRDLTLYQVLQPYPLHKAFIEGLIRDFGSVLVVEETSPVIEFQIARSDKVRGRLDALIPNAGELTPEIIENAVRSFVGLTPKAFSVPSNKPTRRPSLCPGCPHRASFYAIKKVFPLSRSIYTSDIGCYTLGINLKAVDTFICMGGAISQASGFYHAYDFSGSESPIIIATIGDSTFFHAGIPPLIDAVVSGARFVLVILDNSTTAMTGNQPTPASRLDEKGRPKVSIERVVKGCGVHYCKVVDPYDMKGFITTLKGAQRAAQKGVAVVISRAPCLMDKGQRLDRKTTKVMINEHCDGCGYCLREFECPALSPSIETKKTVIDYALCNHCGVCINVCPKGAIESATQ